MHERLDGCEPGVSGIRAIPACRFQMAQEVDNQLRINLLKIQLRRWNFENATGIFQEQLEGIGIRLTGIDAGTAFNWKALLEKRRDMWRDRCHDCTPATK